MPLDWIFGSKKKTEPEPTPPSVNESESNSGGGDDFVMLDNRSPSEGSMRTYPLLPYNLSPGVSTPQGPVSATTKDVGSNQNYLHGVPFKLSSTDRYEDIDSATAYQIRTSQFLSYITEHIDSDVFSYDFGMERSVLREAGSRDLG